MAGMRTINSKDTKLPPAEIIVMVIQQIGSKDVPPKKALAMVAKEAASEKSDTAQFGNTVFLGTRGKDTDANKMFGRAFNVDTGRNYVDNCLRYLEYLRKKGVTHYTTMFEGSEVLKVLQLIEKTFRDTDSELYMGKNEVGSYTAYIKLGSDPIPAAFKRGL